MMNWEAELAVMVWPLNVMTAAVVGIPGRGEWLSTWVLEPPTITRPLPEGASESTVPDTMMEPPGARVWPAMTKSEDGFAVYVAPLNVNSAGGWVIMLPPDPAVAEANDWVEVPPMTAYDPPAASEIGVPETVICWPGLRVWPWTTN